MYFSVVKTAVRPNNAVEMLENFVFVLRKQFHIRNYGFSIELDLLTFNLLNRCTRSQTIQENKLTCKRKFQFTQKLTRFLCTSIRQTRSFEIDFIRMYVLTTCTYDRMYSFITVHWRGQNLDCVSKGIFQLCLAAWSGDSFILEFFFLNRQFVLQKKRQKTRFKC